MEGLKGYMKLKEYSTLSRNICTLYKRAPPSTQLDYGMSFLLMCFPPLIKKSGSFCCLGEIFPYIHSCLCFCTSVNLPLYYLFICSLYSVHLCTRVPLPHLLSLRPLPPTILPLLPFLRPPSPSLSISLRKWRTIRRGILASTLHLPTHTIRRQNLTLGSIDTGQTKHTRILHGKCVLERTMLHKRISLYSLLETMWQDGRNIWLTEHCPEVCKKIPRLVPSAIEPVVYILCIAFHRGREKES